MRGRACHLVELDGVVNIPGGPDRGRAGRTVLGRVHPSRRRRHGADSRRRRPPVGSVLAWWARPNRSLSTAGFSRGRSSASASAFPPTPRTPLKGACSCHAARRRAAAAAFALRSRFSAAPAFPAIGDVINDVIGTPRRLLEARRPRPPWWLPTVVRCACARRCAGGTGIARCGCCSGRGASWQRFPGKIGGGLWRRPRRKQRRARHERRGRLGVRGRLCQRRCAVPAVLTRGTCNAMRAGRTWRAGCGGSDGQVASLRC